MGKHHKWSLNEEEWLTINYPLLTPNICAEQLGVTLSQLRNRVHKLGLTLPEEKRNQLRSKKPSDCNINPDNFLNCDTPEISYLLGLIWADGFLNKSIDGRNHNLGFTMVNEDLIDLKNILKSIGRWNMYERKQTNPNWKASTNVVTNNKRIFKFLIDNDYGDKSQVSADKILNFIPDELKHYWFRGLVDGDGCFYYYKPEKGSKLRQFSISSTFNQDWSFIEKLFDELKINYNIKRISNKHKSSQIMVTNKPGIIQIGDYIYKGFDIDLIGLKRKYDKFKQIKNN